MSTSNGMGTSTIAASQYAKTILTSNNYVQTYQPNYELITYPTKKEKKMNWFKRKFVEWAKTAIEQSRESEYIATKMAPSSHDSINGKTSVRFTIYPASGGHVIEYYKQDRFRDSEGPSLVIVPAGESLGTAIEHALTLESLRA